MLDYDVPALEHTGALHSYPISRRRLLQILGYGAAAGAAGAAGASFLAACGGPNPVGQGLNNPPAPAGTMTSGQGQVRQLDPYFLGYNNVPGHSPSWTDPGTVQAALKLKPGTIRYPGGTVANYWDWQNGWFLAGAPGGFLNATRIPYRLDELQIAVRATGAKPIFVLNMLTSDVGSQLEMLSTAQQMGLPVELVELGNEFYLSHPDDYVTRFPTGHEYGAMATSWIEAIRAHFPHVRIAAVGAVPVNDPSSDPRKASWNQSMLSSLQGADAVTFHPYVSVQATSQASDVASLQQAVSSRWQQFESEFGALPPQMNVWITEYNLVDPKQKVFRTWTDGVLAAQMSLNFLQSPRVERICFYDMIGKTGNEVVFYDLTGQASAHPGLSQFALTAAGWTMSLLGEAIHGMTSAQQLSFDAGSAPAGWLFSDGQTSTGFITNSSPESITWTNIQTIGGIQHFQQYASNPSEVITDASSLTLRSGALGSQLIIPGYSVTGLS